MIKSSKAQPLAKPLLVTTIILSFGMLLGLIASYPTEIHRQKAREINTLQPALWSDNELSEAELKQLETLSSSPEAHYSVSASTVSGFVNFTLLVAVVVWLYKKIRTGRLANNPVYATVNLSVVASFIASLVFLALSAWWVDGLAPFGIAWAIFELVGSIFGAFIISIVVVYIYKGIYDRRHSFEIE